MILERVQGTLEEVIERLQDRDMKTVATCESFTLQRWQEVPSTITSSSRPTTPNDQISATRSESGILSEAGFSERSIPMSAYQFNNMEARGKGVLISDGTQAKAYTVKACKQKKVLDPKSPEARAPMAGSSGRPSKLPIKITKPAPLTSIPEPEEGNEVPRAKNDSESKMSAGIQIPIKTPKQRVPEEKGQVTPDTTHNASGLSRERYLRIWNIPRVLEIQQY